MALKFPVQRVGFTNTKGIERLWGTALQAPMAVYADQNASDTAAIFKEGKLHVEDKQGNLHSMQGRSCYISRQQQCETLQAARGCSKMLAAVRKFASNKAED